VRAKVETRSGLEAIGYTLQDWKFDEAAIIMNLVAHETHARL
jgi:hypothetical protein